MLQLDETRAETDPMTDPESDPHPHPEPDPPLSSCSSDSDLSISEKLIIESNEKRLRTRMSSLQSSILSLKEQLHLEKQLWREDIEKIRVLQQQQAQAQAQQTRQLAQYKAKDIFTLCDSRNSSSLNLNDSCLCNCARYKAQPVAYSPAHFFEMENYKRKLAETEFMCYTELNRLKQNIQDLKHLKATASVWDKKPSLPAPHRHDDEIEEIYLASNLSP